VHGGEARALARQIASAQLLAAQGQGAVAPLHMGTRALAHPGESLRLVMAWVLRLGASRAADATGWKHRGAKPLGTFPQRRAIADGASLGHTSESIRGPQLGGPRDGDRRRHSALSDRRPHIPGDKRAGRVHVRHHARGCVAAFPAAWAASCVRGHGAQRRAVLWASSRAQWAMAAPPALQIDTVGLVAHATEARRDLDTVLRATLVRTTGHIEGGLGVLQTHGGRGGAPWTALCGRVTWVLRVGVPPCELRLGFGDRRVGRPLFSGHGTGDRLDQLGLPLAQGGGVVRCESRCHRGAQPGRFIAGRWEHPAMARCQGWGHQRLPTGLIAGLSPRFPKQARALRVHRHQAQTAGTRVVLGHREVFWGPVLSHACGCSVAGGP
jgi:hypothetical protein